MNNTDIIKDKLNILDVVGSYVKLEKSGKTYKGKSPFTNEKTPSFFVSPEKGFFYCFSSGKGGDMFTFIQEIERIDFREALKILAEKAGVRLENNTEENVLYKKNDRLFKLLDDATKWYEVNLRKNPEVISYLTERGLSKETIITFRLGFAKNDWRDIYNYLISRKYTDQEIAEVGLTIKKEGSGYYDRFRSRIMFPLMDARGRIVGFSGRIFGEPARDSKNAKYVNSPETPLFNKSKVLYGYHSAKTAISKENKCLLVEGQFDVLLAQQAGFQHTVAISGTGLTDDHVRMIHTFGDTILLALDSDSAGIKATRRSVLTAYQHGLNVRVILLPEGNDPADVIKKSKEQWSLCVKESYDYIDYRLALFQRAQKTFEEKKQLVEKDLFTFVYLTQSAILQDKMLQKLGLFLGVTIDSVRNDFKKFKPEENITSSSEIPNSVSNTTDTSKNTQDERIRTILFLWQYIKEKGIPIDSILEKKINETHALLYHKTLDEHLDELDSTEKNIQMFAREGMYENKSESSFGRDLLFEVSREYIAKLDHEINQTIIQIRQAEGRGDQVLAHELTLKNQELSLSKTDFKKNI